MQIYYCEIGVVKCFDVYFEKIITFWNYKLVVIVNPTLFKSSQKVGYDFETTSASSMMIGTFKANGAKAIAIR